MVDVREITAKKGTTDTATVEFSLFLGPRLGCGIDDALRCSCWHIASRFLLAQEA
jgi:hypothetical protein